LAQVFVGEVFGVPTQLLWFILFAVILGLLLHSHKFGSWIYATGDNKEAARAMGINTDLVKIICFMIVGFLCAFSSIIITIRANTFFPGIGTGCNLQAIAGCVIGGTSIFGGIGSILGIILGGLTMVIIENGLTIMGISYVYAWGIYGVIIISFVLLYTYLEKKLITLESK
jgi:simple sugar transport system permease protein